MDGEEKKKIKNEKSDAIKVELSFQLHQVRKQMQLLLNTNCPPPGFSRSHIVSKSLPSNSESFSRTSLKHLPNDAIGVDCHSTPAHNSFPVKSFGCYGDP